MFKFFGGGQAQSEDPIEKRFTRFETKPRVERAPANAVHHAGYVVEDSPVYARRPGKVTPTFPELLAEERKATTRAPQRAAAPLPAPQPSPSKHNDAADLHASDDVPLWVFQKALPKRFADMRTRQDGLVFQ